MRDYNEYKNALDNLELISRTSTTVNSYTIINQIDILKELVDKELLKKVIAKPTKNSKYLGYRVHERYNFHCPNCSKQLSLIRHNKHCPDCGQALDWSHISEKLGRK